MDVWNGQIMDVGLTITGYLAAAGLGMLLHSVVVGRRRRVAVVAPAEGRPGETDRRTTADLSPQVQFIDLRTQRSGNASVSASTALASTGRDGRRDRVEIIRMARQMLNAGTSADRVRRALPISEAELSLLQSIEAN
jgi:hypothetical protein